VVDGLKIVKFRNTRASSENDDGCTFRVLSGFGGHLATEKNVVFYTKEGCSLCEEVGETLHRVKEEIPFRLKTYDVEKNPNLSEIYSDRVPLIKINGRVAFKLNVDENRLRSMLLKTEDED
jgi:glutaredoxin